MARSVYARYGSSTITGIEAVQRKHTVRGGETIPSIAVKWFPALGYDSEYWRQVAEANGIDDLDVLAVGAVLNIPPPAASNT